MSNAIGKPKRASGAEANREGKGDNDTSGERPAMPHAGYAGLMSLGSEAFSAPLPPPQSEHPRISPRVRIAMYVLGAALGVSLGAVGVAVVLTRAPEPTKSEPTKEADADREPIAKGVTAALVHELPEERAPQAKPDDPPVAKEEPAAEPAPTEAATAAVAPSTDAPAEDAAEEPAAAEAAKSSSSSKHARSERTSRSRKPRDSGAVPQRLSREQVITAMNRVQPAVTACFGGTRGSAMAAITIIGRTGRVTTAQISGQGGAVGSCIARAVRGATFPRFADDSLTIRYPFAR
jgi:hypothetical protein